MHVSGNIIILAYLHCVYLYVTCAFCESEWFCGPSILGLAHIAYFQDDENLTRRHNPRFLLQMGTEREKYNVHMIIKR